MYVASTSWYVLRRLDDADGDLFPISTVTSKNGTIFALGLSHGGKEGHILNSYLINPFVITYFHTTLTRSDDYGMHWDSAVSHPTVGRLRASNVFYESNDGTCSLLCTFGGHLPKIDATVLHLLQGSACSNDFGKSFYEHAALPFALLDATATYHGEFIYLFGGWNPDFDHNGILRGKVQDCVVVQWEIITDQSPLGSNRISPIVIRSHVRNGLYIGGGLTFVSFDTMETSAHIVSDFWFASLDSPLTNATSWNKVSTLLPIPYLKRSRLKQTRPAWQGVEVLIPIKREFANVTKECVRCFGNITYTRSLQSAGIPGLSLTTLTDLHLKHHQNRAAKTQIPHQKRQLSRANATISDYEGYLPNFSASYDQYASLFGSFEDYVSLFAPQEHLRRVQDSRFTSTQEPVDPDVFDIEHISPHFVPSTVQVVLGNKTTPFYIDYTMPILYSHLLESPNLISSNQWNRTYVSALYLLSDRQSYFSWDEGRTWQSFGNVKHPNPQLDDTLYSPDLYQPSFVHVDPFHPSIANSSNILSYPGAGIVSYAMPKSNTTFSSTRVTNAIDRRNQNMVWLGWLGYHCQTHCHPGYYSSGCKFSPWDYVCEPCHICENNDTSILTCADNFLGYNPITCEAYMFYNSSRKSNSTATPTPKAVPTSTPTLTFPPSAMDNSVPGTSVDLSDHIDFVSTVPIFFSIGFSLGFLCFVIFGMGICLGVPKQVIVYYLFPRIRPIVVVAHALLHWFGSFILGFDLFYGDCPHLRTAGSTILIANAAFLVIHLVGSFAIFFLSINHKSSAHYTADSIQALTTVMRCEPDFQYFSKLHLPPMNTPTKCDLVSTENGHANFHIETTNSEYECKGNDADAHSLSISRSAAVSVTVNRTTPTSSLPGVQSLFDKVFSCLMFVISILHPTALLLITDTSTRGYKFSNAKSSKPFSQSPGNQQIDLLPPIRASVAMDSKNSTSATESHFQHRYLHSRSPCTCPFSRGEPCSDDCIFFREKSKSFQAIECYFSTRLAKPFVTFPVNQFTIAWSLTMGLLLDVFFFCVYSYILLLPYQPDKDRALLICLFICVAGIFGTMGWIIIQYSNIRTFFAMASFADDVPSNTRQISPMAFHRWLAQCFLKRVHYTSGTPCYSALSPRSEEGAATPIGNNLDTLEQLRRTSAARHYLGTTSRNSSIGEGKPGKLYLDSWDHDTENPLDDEQKSRHVGFPSASRSNEKREELGGRENDASGTGMALPSLSSDSGIEGFQFAIDDVGLGQFAGLSLGISDADGPSMSTTSDPALQSTTSSQGTVSTFQLHDRSQGDISPRALNSDIVRSSTMQLNNIISVSVPQESIAESSPRSTTSTNLATVPHRTETPHPSHSPSATESTGTCGSTPPPLRFYSSNVYPYPSYPISHYYPPPMAPLSLYHRHPEADDSAHMNNSYGHLAHGQDMSTPTDGTYAVQNSYAMPHGNIPPYTAPLPVSHPRHPPPISHPTPLVRAPRNYFGSVPYPTGSRYSIYPLATTASIFANSEDDNDQDPTVLDSPKSTPSLAEADNKFDDTHFDSDDLSAQISRTIEIASRDATPVDPIADEALDAFADVSRDELLQQLQVFDDGTLPNASPETLSRLYYRLLTAVSSNPSLGQDSEIQQAFARLQRMMCPGFQLTNNDVAPSSGESFARLEGQHLRETIGGLQVDMRSLAASVLE